MSKLLHLPNISQELEQKLIKAGIEKPEQLREKGSRNVFVKIKSFDSSTCYNMLLALEGAIQGKLADELDENTKNELKLFMEIFNQ
nr:TfoX/Sxy family protein [Bacteroidota bacterium]